MWEFLVTGRYAATNTAQELTVPHEGSPQ